MNNKTIWLSIIAVILSFIGGFILANGLNRNELEKLRLELTELQKDKSAQNSNEQPEISLSDEEIKQRIAEADQNPKDFDFQKKLGVSLYKYAAMKKDTNLLSAAERILDRAIELNSKDYEVIVSLGHLHFDIGYFKNENIRYAKARKFYETALNQKPDDVEIRTEVGITYLLEKPNDAKKAITELQKSLTIEPKHEKTLYFLTQALLMAGNDAEAEKTLAKLKEINAKAPTIEEFKAQIKQEDKSQDRK